MQLKAFLLSVLPSMAIAQSCPGWVDPSFYNTVAEIYSGPDCNPDTLVWADPIFGCGGSCQKLDRNDNTPDIVSYKVLREYPDCNVTLYTDSGCLSTAYPAPVGECVQAPEPLLMAFVACAWN